MVMIIETSHYNVDLILFVRGLMVTNVGFEFCDRSPIPIVYQIINDSLRQFVYA